MTRPDFIFFIQNKDNLFWKRNSDGDVEINSTAKPLDYSPEEWDQITIQNVRNKQYFDVDRIASLPFKYVEDGAAILKHIMITKGINEPVFLSIGELNLAIDPPPSAIISGSNPFSAGTNLGTITGQPGETIYVKVKITGTIADTLFGNIGGTVLVNMNATGQPIIYTIILPNSGVINYNLLYTNGSGTGVAGITIVDINGSATGNYGYWYKMIFKSRIDLSTFNHDGPIVESNVIEEGFAKHLKANENTSYPIPLDCLAKRILRQDGVILSMAQHDGIAGGFLIDQDTFQLEINLPIYAISNEGTAPYVLFQDSLLEDFHIDNSTFKYAVGSNNYFCKILESAPAPITLNFSKKLRIQVINQRTVSDFRINFWHVPAGATATTPGIRTILFTSGTIMAGQILEYDFANIGPIVGNAGDRFFISLDRNPEASDSDLSDYIILADSECTISFQSKYKETEALILPPQYIFDQLIRLMSDNEYSAADCPYFDTNSDKNFTSGDGIRSIIGAVFTISLSDFYSFWNCWDSVGLHENDGKKILFDRKANLINQANVSDAGTAVKLVTSFDKELPFNELHMGYENVSNEQGDVNGKNEFNTTSVWSLGTVLNPRTYEKISKIQASCYAQEQLRIDNFLKDTTDNRSDNTPFVIHVNALPGADGKYTYNRTRNPFLTGVIDRDTIFNTGLSPKICLLNNGDEIRSYLYLSDDKILKFINNDRNSGMVYINGSDVVIEASDVPVGSLKPKIFLPFLLIADVKGIDNALDKIKFDFDGYTYYGLSIQNSINPKTNKIQTYTMWSFPENNLLPLIKYYGG